MSRDGANGDVTTMVLPGNLSVTFSGHDVRHADGRQLQRVGIQPTIRVERTIRGLVDGRDEILDAAVKFSQTYRKTIRADYRSLDAFDGMAAATG